MSRFTPEQQAENRSKLVAALKSGQYARTVGMLESRNGGFCPLGIACHLAAKEDVVIRQVWPHYIEYNGSASYLPYSVKDWLGFADIRGTLDRPAAHRVNSIAAMNDYGATFGEVAEMIEQGRVLLAEPEPADDREPEPELVGV